MELPSQHDLDWKRGFPEYGLSRYGSRCKHLFLSFPAGWRLTFSSVSKISKLFNYMQREVAKTVTFCGLIVAWSYFRIYLNINMLWSVWFEFDLIPCVTPLFHLPPFSFSCIQGRVHAMGTRNRSLDGVVDEVSNFHPYAPPAIPEPLLVLLDLEDRISVCPMTPAPELS